MRRQTTTTTQQTGQTQQQTGQTQTGQTQTGTVVSGSSQQTTVTTQQTSFSRSVQTAVFQAIAQRSQINVSQLRLVEVRRRAWATSCLGLNISGRSCAQVMTPGYLVVASSGNQVFVYRTDATGSVVLFDQRATEIRTAQIRSRSTAISFRDVSANHWAASFIRELAALDIVDGYPDGSYRPDQPVTRAEFAAIIRRAFNEAEVREAINFLDVDRRYWAYGAIQETYRMGFLSTVANNLFRPVNSISKGDVLFALATGLRVSTTSSTDTLLSVYNQTNLSVEQRTLLAALTEQGIVVNYPDIRSINLDRTVTRAEVAVIVYQTLASLGCVPTIESPHVIDGGDVVTIDNDRDDDDDDDDDDDE
ncbi:MAG: S-layer homology domain-containing protein [Leptolyngbyaceae cyanobacterium SM1_3_5]|nr:S-layer homology domain-containing protein [Leptolyngbyaceae cyanobacterium SM1_3_5]